mgnify:CR=1 FL=1
MSEFSVWEPSSLEHALNILAAHKGQALPLAGGTDLLVQINKNTLKYKNLVSLEGLEELSRETIDVSSVSLGAAMKIAAIECHEELIKKVPFLARAASELGSRQVRNLATIGGNLCNAAPSAEMAPPLLALNASVSITSPEGKRFIPLETLFTGPGQTVLRSYDLVDSIEFYLPQGIWHGAYYKLSPRRAMDIAVVNVAVVIVVDHQNREKLTGARIALGAVAPTPVRAYEAEALLNGKILTDETIDLSSRLSAKISRPITDIRATADYRRAMVYELVKKGLQECRNSLMQGGVGSEKEN